MKPDEEPIKKVEESSEEKKDITSDIRQEVIDYLEKNSEEFFPDQKITYFNFKGLHAVIQTTLNNSEIEIEYQVNPNLIDNSDIGPEDEKKINKQLDPENPFVLTIDSSEELPEDVEMDFLKSFEKIFINLLAIIFKKIEKENIT